VSPCLWRDELVRDEYAWEAGEYEQMAVKIADVLDETWFGLVESLKH
jgi:hypothetical protein